jgi:hypothetical protein
MSMSAVSSAALRGAPAARAAASARSASGSRPRVIADANPHSARVTASSGVRAAARVRPGRRVLDAVMDARQYPLDFRARKPRAHLPALRRDS